MKQKRKGFTLVELLVVIAILAILATVSVVGYLSFTEKAKQSNDESLIAQLNTVLQGNEAIDGKPNTMYDALTQVKDSGFLVENLTPTSAKNEFLWNQEENRFIIVAADSLESTKNPSLWVIVNDETTLANLQDNYSVYLGSKYTDTDGIVNVANGFDAGDYDGITTINFATDANITVTIRTNGGTLNINAENATVHHYATAQTLDIAAVDNESYHEYGTILGNVYLKQGRFVAENDSTISNVVVTATSTENVKIVNNATETLNVSATNESVSISLDNITSGKTNNQTTVVDEDTLKLFAGGLGTKESPYLISTYENFTNIRSGDKNNIINYLFINDIYFEKGIKNDALFGAPIEYWGIYHQTGWFEYMNIDGNNKNLHIVGFDGAPEQLFLFNGVRNSSIINMNIYYPSTNSCYVTTSIDSVTFSNVDLYGGGNSEEAYTLYMQCGINYFIDCDSYVDINNEFDYTSVFALQCGVENGNTMEVTFRNCTFNGKLISPQASMFLSNTYDTGKKIIKIYDCYNNGIIQSLSPTTTTNNYIAISCTNNVEIYVEDEKVESIQTAEFNSGRNFISQSDVTFSAVLDDNKLILNKATDSKVSYYIIYQSIYGSSKDGTLKQTTALLKIDNTFETKVELDNPFYEFVCDDTNSLFTDTGKTTFDGTTIVSDDLGKEYVLYSGNGEYTVPNPSEPNNKYVIAFDSNGNVLYYSQI